MRKHNITHGVSVLEEGCIDCIIIFAEDSEEGKDAFYKMQINTNTFTLGYKLDSTFKKNIALILKKIQEEIKNKKKENIQVLDQVGKTLWNLLFPEKKQEKLLKFFSNPQNIFLVTDEQYIPFEYVLPHSGDNLLEHLGFNHRISRWFRKNGDMPSNCKKFFDTAILTADKKREGEIKNIQNKFNERDIKTKIEAKREKLINYLEDGSGNILHFTRRNKTTLNETELLLISNNNHYKYEDKLLFNNSSYSSFTNPNEDEDNYKSRYLKSWGADTYIVNVSKLDTKKAEEFSSLFYEIFLKNERLPISEILLMTRKELLSQNKASKIELLAYQYFGDSDATFKHKKSKNEYT